MDASIAFRLPDTATDPVAVIAWDPEVALPASIVGTQVVVSLPAAITETWQVGEADLTVTATLQGGPVVIGTEPVTVSRDAVTRRDLLAALAAALDANTTYLSTAPDDQVAALTRQINDLIQLSTL
jgi:hypothetical protein